MNQLQCLPIIIGSEAFRLKKPVSQNTHRWRVYVKSQGDFDLSPFFKSVNFRLHESFQNPSRNVTSSPFEISETGWGEFVIQIRLNFKASSIKPIFTSHQLRLHPLQDIEQPFDVPVISETFDEIVFFEGERELESYKEFSHERQFIAENIEVTEEIKKLDTVIKWFEEQNRALQ